MKTPSFLKKNSTIGMLAPSFGVFEEPYITRYRNAKNFFVSLGYSIKEAKSIYSENFLNDAKASIRAKEFMDMYLDDSVDVLFSVAGGELMIEILEYIDFELLKKAKPKFFMGYSDNTNLTFTLSTICDIKSIYGINATAYGKNHQKYIMDHFALITGEKKVFHSYPFFEGNEEEVFSEEVKYVGECDLKGMLLGGCMEVLQGLCGTKYDNMKEFNKKYDKIIFYLEPCYLRPLQIRTLLWQLRNASWFDNVVCFVFGRSCLDDSNLTYIEAINRALEDLNVPIIVNADIGHIAPILPIVNGAMARISVKNGKGIIEYD